MKLVTTWFLRLVIVLVALGAVAVMILFPQTEGRAANLDLVHIYADPFLIYGYLASTPFFFALYQGFKLLGYFGRTEVFSLPAVTAVRTIKYCALAMPVLIAAGEVFIVLNANGDDSAGAVAFGIGLSLLSLVVAAGAATLERLLRNGFELKSELTQQG